MDRNKALSNIFNEQTIGIIIAIAFIVGSISGGILGFIKKNDCMKGSPETYHRMGYDENGDFHTDYETKTFRAQICESEGFGEYYILGKIFQLILISTVLFIILAISLEMLNTPFKIKIISYVALSFLIILISFLLANSYVENKKKEEKKKQETKELEEAKEEEIKSFRKIWETKEFKDHYNVTLSIFDDNACYYGYYDEDTNDKDKMHSYDRYECSYEYKNNKIKVEAGDKFECSIKDDNLVCEEVNFNIKKYR